MPRVLIALGANLGNRQETLQRALERLAHLANSPPRASRFHETAPIGGPAGQGAFLNAAAVVETALAPGDLHTQLRNIEDSLGRQRDERWAARTIDLDLLLYEDDNGASQIILTPQLQVPHSRMAFRRFVLEPAAEVASDMTHPLLGRTLGQLLEHLNRGPRLIIVVGRPEQQPDVLAQAVCQASGARWIHLDGAADLESVYLSMAHSDPSGRPPAPPIQLPDRDQLPPQPGRPDSKWTIAAVRVDHGQPDWLARQSVQPMLLVALEDWTTSVRARLDATPSPAGVFELAGQIGCPLLCAGASDPAAQLNEITAALAAMD
jgi:2-amino-4-hydroxy-6-hydroxymethyldihydropteridine diphosphokinase